MHPRYLDRQGLTAAWREGLLAQKVLTGTTKGYRNHPQLRRFRVGDVHPVAPGDPPLHPGAPVLTFLHGVADEAVRRGYSYDRGLLLGPPDVDLRLEVTDGQLAHEWLHLRLKLARRSPDVLATWRDVDVPDPHPLFDVVPGPVAEWEVVTDLTEPPDPGTSGRV